MKFTLFLSLLLVEEIIEPNKLNLPHLRLSRPQLMTQLQKKSVKQLQIVTGKFLKLSMLIMTMKLILQKLQNCTMNMDGQNQKKQWMIKIN